MGVPEAEDVIWEREPHRQLLEPDALPQASDKPMPGEDFGALIRAARWTAFSLYLDLDADGPLERMPICSPFHGAVRVEDYQLVPLLKALQMPRINLMIADDVGLGKTIEAGLILRELLIRRRIQRILILTPAALRLQWRDEMSSKFSMPFDVVDRQSTQKLKRTMGIDANPWQSSTRAITSYHYLKQPDVLEQFLSASRRPEDSPHLPRDMLVVDEVHNLMPVAFGEDSDLCNTLHYIAPLFEHRLFRTATPHNGRTRSFREDTADDREFQQKESTAAKVIGAWLKDLEPHLKAEIADIDAAVAGLGIDLEIESTISINPKEDARFTALTNLIDGNLRDGQKWQRHQRVVVFTEYKTTLDYLQRRIREHYKGSSERILCLFGVMEDTTREQIEEATGSTAIEADSTIHTPEQEKETLQRLTDLASELDLDPSSKQSVLDSAMSVHAGRPQLSEPDDEGKSKIVNPSLAGWSETIDESVRRNATGSALGPVPYLAFSVDPFLSDVGGRQIFRPRHDVLMMHPGHPMMRKAISSLGRR